VKWPACPRCGENELFSLDMPATIESIVGCYACGWKTEKGEADLRAAFGETA
jgi:uncharacterized protein (DUF983 family)